MAVNAYHSHYHKKRKTRKKTSIDRLVYFAVFFGPLMTLPQVYDIWILDKTGVSVVSWVSYALIGLIWLAYGIKHKDKPIIMVQLLWLLMDALIVAGVMLS